jgi:hypothetical protein
MAMKMTTNPRLMSWKMRKSGKRARLDEHVVLEVERGVYWAIGIGLVGWRVSGRGEHQVSSSCEFLLVIPLPYHFWYSHAGSGAQQCEADRVRLGPLATQYTKRIVAPRQKRAALAPVQRPEEIVQDKEKKVDDTLTFVKKVHLSLWHHL